MTASVSSSLKQLIQQYLWKDQACENMHNGGWRYNGFLRYQFNHELAVKLLSYIKANGFRDGADFGCGCGYYVAYLRKHGFPISGYDANPYTSGLSRLLLPTGDFPCVVADMTDDYDEDTKFDIVLCLDVITHVPECLQPKALDNLFKLCNESLVISFDANNMSAANGQMLTHLLKKYGFYVNRISSNILYDKNAPSMEYRVLEKIHV